ncbi:MAG: penicillin-binding protein activator LpoB [Bacteroidetes bacterium]|nr:penicillin-binding protein activator LpoB [Bacteroidota bacterium]
MMKRFIQLSMIALSCLIIASCTTQRKVERVSYDQKIDLSGRWNDTDSWETAQNMITQILNGRWISDYKKYNDNERPKVIVGLVKNRSHEHIDAETFIKDMEKAFIKTGAIRLIQGGESREEIRFEREDQQTNALPSTVKQWGRELGADFMLQGTINSIVDEVERQMVIYYQIDLTLTNLESNEVVWIGDEKIKKYVRK